MSLTAFCSTEWLIGERSRSGTELFVLAWRLHQNTVCWHATGQLTLPLWRLTHTDTPHTHTDRHTPYIYIYIYITREDSRLLGERLTPLQAITTPSCSRTKRSDTLAHPHYVISQSPACKCSVFTIHVTANMTSVSSVNRVTLFVQIAGNCAGYYYEWPDLFYWLEYYNVER